MNIPSSEHSVRVRFAPSPTGFMHLGNVRAALMNYLFARQKEGDFIVRIEDTDQQRNISPQTIFNDLAWLGLTYNEGPSHADDRQGGPYAPYFQSLRTGIYQEYLEQLKAKKSIYRCFCTMEDLEKKRLRQIALRNPPRYDKTCAALSMSDITDRLSKDIPFIWRFMLDNSSVSIHDMARGTITYDLNHFSDFALTRPDGSFTFIFANFVDDLVMHISHVIRGEDHLSNTANQAALYRAFEAKAPIFWHLPIIANSEGKKLSKRDFGFSLTDLREAGFLPEAINNYLAIIGGSFEQEVMSLEETTRLFNFNKVSSTGHVRYATEKLRWLNHQWIMRLDLEDLAQRCRPFIVASHPTAYDISIQRLAELLGKLRDSIETLADSASSLAFLFTVPTVTPELLESYQYKQYQPLMRLLAQEQDFQNTKSLSQTATAWCKERNLTVKNFFALLRIALTGNAQGHAIADLLAILPAEEVRTRLHVLL